MIKDLGWFYVKREDLASAFKGDFNKSNLLNEPVEASLSDDTAALGYGYENGAVDLFPTVLIVSETKSREFFAWVSTYTPDIFPLSQHVRIITFSEYETLRFFTRSRVSAKDRYPAYALASLVLGELLCYVDGFDNISSIPGSRAMTCWSLPMARCFEIYKRRSVSDICLMRLTNFSKDSRFVKKELDLEDIALAFHLFDRCFRMEGSILNKSQIIIDSLSKVVGKSFNNHKELYSTDIIEEFETNSFEKRIITFRKISNAIFMRRVEGEDNRLLAFLLALSVYMVGRGTSHVFLLKEWRKSFPSVYLWFGLIISLVEVDTWTADWIKLTKLVEKLLRSSFDIKDSSSSDLYWLEFEWILKTYETNEIFNKFPRFSPGGIGVEIYPGANYQYRLSRDSSPITTRSDPSFSEKSNFVSDEIKNIFSQLLDISKRAENIIKNDYNISMQTSMDFESKEKNKGYPKKSRVKKKDF